MVIELVHRVAVIRDPDEADIRMHARLGRSVRRCRRPGVPRAVGVEDQIAVRIDGGGRGAGLALGRTSGPGRPGLTRLPDGWRTRDRLRRSILA